MPHLTDEHDNPEDESTPSPQAGKGGVDGGARSLAAVKELLGPLCIAHGVDLVGVAWVTEHGMRTLRVTIERRGQAEHEDPSLELTRGWGVTLEDCAELSRDLSQALDHDEGAISGSYSLEVSSPGLEREITSLEDFLRFRGRLVRVKLAKPAPDGQRLLRGSLDQVEVAADGQAHITVTVDGKPITAPFADVKEANLVFELAPSPKKETSRRAKKQVSKSKTKNQRSLSKGSR